MIRSWVDEIEGVGPKNEKILQSMDMSMSELAELSVLELINKFEVSEKIALNIFEYLKQGDQDGVDPIFEGITSGTWIFFRLPNHIRTSSCLLYYKIFVI